jgi:hypothetical protein
MLPAVKNLVGSTNGSLVSNTAYTYYYYDSGVGADTDFDISIFANDTAGAYLR